MKNSPLQLLRYVAPNIALSANPAFDPQRGCEDGSEQFSVQAVVSRQKAQEPIPGHPWSVEVTISQKLKAKQNFPYTFDITLLGFFLCAEGLPPSAEEELFVRVNGSSMLYGAARELVRSLTARGPWGELFLPAISFYPQKEPRKQEESTPAAELTS